MPVCARCTGIIVGDIVALFFAALRQYPLICLALLLPLMVDGLLQLKTCYFSTNRRRFLTGFLFGLGMVSLIFYGVRQLFASMA